MERSCANMYGMWMVRSRTQTLDLEPCRCMSANECARKYACEGVLFTPPVGYSGSLSTVNETCNKDKRTLHKKKYCRCTSFKSRTFKSGVHLFAALENSLKYLVGVFQCKSSNLPRQRVSACLSLRFCLTLFDRFCLKENSSLSSEFLCMTVGCRGDSAFALGLKI